MCSASKYSMECVRGSNGGYRVVGIRRTGAGRDGLSLRDMERRLYFAALAATAFIAPGARSREVLLRVFVWFAFVVSVLSVVAHYTLPGSVLGISLGEHLDVWGPFLSRNNFAAFLELAMPVALWLAVGRTQYYLWIAAAILAAGMASASRAGAVLLTIETVAVFALRPDSRRAMVRFAAAAVVLIAIAGAGPLERRIFEPDPLRYRREMARSAMAMIRDHPLAGFGLGTFSTVYPQYAEFDAGAKVDHAHNEWLEWTSEGGIGFGAAWAILGVSMLRRARRSIWLIGVPAVMIHSLVDYPSHVWGKCVDILAHRHERTRPRSALTDVGRQQ